jgi:Inner membrane component of T3SS, cytoplasmic domain
MSSGRRIVLGEDDFKDPPPTQPATPPVASSPPQQSAAAAPATLPPIARHAPLQVGGAAPFAGTLAPQSRSFINDPRFATLVPAVVGMLLAWGVAELTNVVNLANRAKTKTGLDAYVGLWTGLLAVVFVAVLVGFDRAVGGAWSEAGRRAVRSLVPAALAGFLAGFAAQAVYIHMLESAFKAGDFTASSARIYLARAVGWAIFGLGVGVVLGIIDRSSKKAVNGAVGGLVGGAIGGVVFQFSGIHLSSSDRLARLLGLLAIAVLVAVATRAVETARREAWLRVVAGGMAGKEFILYHAITRIGSAPQCEIFLLKDSAVEPLHAQIEDHGRQRILTASPAAPVLVNGSPATSHTLSNGDTLQIGKTVISYAERAPAPAAVAATPYR